MSNTNRFIFQNRAALQNEEGETYFVNEYSTDSEGITRRETIADNLTEQEADALTSRN